MNIITKIILIILICGIGFCLGAYVRPNNNDAENYTKKTREQIKTSTFESLFREITIENVPYDIFTLIATDNAVITAGSPEHFNSMVAGWGGWGIQFQKPVFWLMLRSNRYTLELMRETQTYTLTFFDEDYRADFMPLGATSGRDNPDKMKDITLSAVETPDGLMTYKEAKLIIECKLMQVTSVSPDDYYIAESKDFVEKAYEETGDWHKLVYGEIVKVWVRN